MTALAANIRRTYKCLTIGSSDRGSRPRLGQGGSR
jgi:hypothetical protein